MSCSVFNPFGWNARARRGVGWGMWFWFIVLAAVGFWIYSSTYRTRAYRWRRKDDPIETRAQAKLLQ